MAFLEKIRKSIPTLSYELFPPKNPTGWGTLYATLSEIAKQAPDYISVTYGAGGSTRDKTVDMVGRIQNELGIESMAHLTCVGHSRDELQNLLQSLQKVGIRNVLALRGDPPKGDTAFKPHPDGFAHASDLIEFIREQFTFNLGCAYYPEKHVEAPTLEEDILHLKLKQDRGADVAISQLFFDNENFYRFRDLAYKAGVRIPLVAGIMPVLELKQLPRFQQLSGCVVPEKLVAALGEGQNEEIQERGIEYATRQCLDLLANGIAGIHLYCLNRYQSSVRITENLRREGHFRVESDSPES